MQTTNLPFIKDHFISPLYDSQLPETSADQSAAALDCRGGASADLAPEYPDAEAFVAAKYFFHQPVANQRAVDRIVVHITAGQSDYQRTVKFFQDPTRHGDPIKVSAHYVVGQGGQVVQMVRHNDIAYHASSANKRSIGIEHTARPPRTFSSSDQGLMPTPIQYESSARLVRYLCEQYGLPLDRQHIVGHNEADPNTTHTDCPTGAWDWSQFMQAVLADE